MPVVGDAANALMMVLHRVIQPHVMAESFVDDLTMSHQEVPELQAALDHSDEIMKATDQEVNACKTKGVGLKSEPDLKFRGAPLANTGHLHKKGATLSQTPPEVRDHMMQYQRGRRCKLLGKGYQSR